MSQYITINNGSTKLTAQLLAAGTTANVTAGDGALFAGATGGNIIRATLVKMSGFKEIAWEIVDVTARSTDALTITRAREGTTALQFEIGDKLSVRYTAETASVITPTWGGTAGGTANALTLTPANAIRAYSAGMSFNFIAGGSNNSGATTLAVSGLSTIAVQVNGAACVGKEIQAGGRYRVTLDSTSTCQLTPLAAAEITSPGALFTPAVIGSTTAGTGTYSQQRGKYTKMGNLVFFKLYLAWSAHTGTGNMRIDISGIPFTAIAGDLIDNSCTIGYITNIALTAGYVAAALIPPNVTYITMYQAPSGGGAITAVPIDTAGEIEISGFIFV